MGTRLWITLAVCAVTAAACGGGGHGSSSSVSNAAGATTTEAPATTAAPVAAGPTTTATPGATPTTAGSPSATVANRAPAPTAAPAPPTTAKPAATTTAAPTGTVVSSTNNPKYGAILVDGQGRTLYEFTPDNGSASPQCAGSCAATWPPLKATGTPHAEGSVKQNLLGVEAGQVTYNGHPLYRYSGDSAAGQTNGQGVGGIWYVMSTSGAPVLK